MRGVLLRLIVFSMVLLSAFYTNAQRTNVLRVGTVVPLSLLVELDSLSIIPGSFSLLGIPSDAFALDPIAAKLYLKDSTLLGKPLIYRYEVFQFDFSKPYKHKPLSLIEQSRKNKDPIHIYSQSSSPYEYDSKLVTSGSLSRGLSVGNSQDLVLNSSLNLQLTGDLSEDVHVVASISDKNIPIQPDGSTTNISYINNIFITILYKDILKIDAGDVNVASPFNSQFLSLSRNLLGMDAHTNISSWKKVKMSNSIGGGVAKGRFNRQKLVVQNGIQGPYKLYGASNEVGIVIVAGSERVYVDGVLLTRGQERDYVIDYNTAEITFTPAQMVVEEKRVFVEFEYTDRHYTRYGLFSYNDIEMGEKKNFKLHVNFYQEQDLKNQSIQPELDDRQKIFLSTLEDYCEEAYFDFSDSTEYNANRVLYCKRDTIVEGVFYPSVYEYCTDAAEQLYNVSFTYMGPNQGSYVLLRSSSNGRVFGWVAPENGVLKGDYSPVLLLTTPKLTQMTTIGASYEFTDKTFVNTEFALSNIDQNLFSKEDNHNKVGFAYSLLLNYDHPLRSKKEEVRPWRLRSILDWQFVHRNFRTVESFRNVEFARDYNLSDDYSNDFSEQMLHALVGFSKEERSSSYYEVNWFSRLGNYSAVRQQLVTKNRVGHWNLQANGSFLLADDTTQKSRYWTANLLTAYQLQFMEIGVSDKAECNLFSDSQTDTLRNNSFAFNEFLFFVKNGDTSLYKYNISYKNRIEYAPLEGDLCLDLNIHEVNASFAFDRIKNQHFSTRFTYRSQQNGILMERKKLEHYYVGNVEYVGRFFKNALFFNTYYEVGSGMEQKRCFSYLKVSPGQGTHVWNDYNNNGIEELDEFEMASFQDEADYVKIWLAGAEYVNTYNSQVTQSVQLRPAAVWAGKTGFKRFLARFTEVATLRIMLKNVTPHFNPFYTNLKDTNVVSDMLNFNNTFTFNNSSSKFAFDFVVQKSQNKNLLYYGFEINRMESQQLVLKSHPCRWLFLRMTYAHGISNNHSEFLDNRCYDVENNTLGTGIVLQFQRQYRGEFSYDFENKENRGGVERLFSHKVSTDFECRMAKRGVIVAKVSYVRIFGTIEEQSPVGYQMLNGLTVGDNALWHLSYQLSVTDFLQLSMQYDGRASYGHKIAHTGSLTVKANF